MITVRSGVCVRVCPVVLVLEGGVGGVISLLFFTLPILNLVLLIETIEIELLLDAFLAFFLPSEDLEAKGLIDASHHS